MTVSFGWGPAEARALTGPDPVGAARTACVVVVDVLSFTTAVGVAVEAGSAVHPYRRRDASAETYAREKDAVRGRVRKVPPGPRRLARTLAALSESSEYVQYEDDPPPCDRGSASEGRMKRRDGASEASAVHQTPRALPCGRTALLPGHDLAALRAACPDLTLTPEATAAATLWTATKGPVAALRGCASGRELYAYGCPQDVEVAAETDASTTVPVLVDGAFQEAP
ncbi:hypothetical protein ACFVQ4_18625 [Streptomyces laurentii]|uniref:hypothetical protein n=1 Tax=Streptomyces laurentii TaxID=39478 RepID=UPI0036904928